MNGSFLMAVFSTFVTPAYLLELLDPSQFDPLALIVNPPAVDKIALLTAGGPNTKPC